jgi:hypothetical protein
VLVQDPAADVTWVFLRNTEVKSLTVSLRMQKGSFFAQAGQPVLGYIAHLNQTNDVSALQIYKQLQALLTNANLVPYVHPATCSGA